MRVVYNGDQVEAHRWLGAAQHQLYRLRVSMQAQGLTFGRFRRYFTPYVFTYGYILPNGLEAVYITAESQPFGSCVDKVPENPPWEGSPTYWALDDGLEGNYTIDQRDLRLLCPDFQILTTIPPNPDPQAEGASGQMITIEPAPQADYSITFRVKWEGPAPATGPFLPLNPGRIDEEDVGGSGGGRATVGIRIGEVEVPIVNNPHYPMETHAPIGYFLQIYVTSTFDEGGVPGQTLAYVAGSWFGDWPSPGGPLNVATPDNRLYTTSLDHVFTFRATNDGLGGVLIEVLVDDVVTFSYLDNGPDPGIIPVEATNPHLETGKLYVAMQNTEGPGMLQLTSNQWDAPFSATPPGYVP